MNIKKSLSFTSEAIVLTGMITLIALSLFINPYKTAGFLYNISILVACMLTITFMKVVERVLARILFRIEFGVFPPRSKYDWLAMRAIGELVSAEVNRAKHAKNEAKVEMQRITDKYQWIADRPSIETAAQAQAEIKRLANWSPDYPAALQKFATAAKAVETKSSLAEYFLFLPL